MTAINRHGSGERTRTPIYGTKNRCPTIERPRKVARERAEKSVASWGRHQAADRVLARYGITGQKASEADAQEKAQEDAAPHPPSAQVAVAHLLGIG
jgi:hypothetical protein